MKYKIKNLLNSNFDSEDIIAEYRKINNEYIQMRIMYETECMLNKNYTIRDIAKLFNVSKSTVFVDLDKRLPNIDKDKHQQIRLVLESHKVKPFKGRRQYVHSV